MPDPDDEHLVAAAFVAGAGAIVTSNDKDVPTGKLPRGIRRVSPQEFAYDTVSADPVQAWKAVGEIIRRSGRQGPKWSADDVLDLLVLRYGMTDAAELLRQVGPFGQTDA